MVRLHSYIVKRDFGFAPNPFFGYCTLAACKPVIRRTAKVGDWIVGTGSKSENLDGRLVYAMRLTDVLSFNKYWNDPRFKDKRPDLHSSQKRAYGDNIYFWDESSGRWCQIDSHHSYSDGTPNARNIQHDTSADRVLISDDFVYFGCDGPEVPEFEGVSILCTSQGHKNKFPRYVVEGFIEWVRGLDETGYCGIPGKW